MGAWPLPGGFMMLVTAMGDCVLDAAGCDLQQNLHLQVSAGG